MNTEEQLELTPKEKQEAEDVYNMIFDSFAATTKDLEKKFGFRKAKVLKICHMLEDVGLIVGELSKVDTSGFPTGISGYRHKEKPGTMYVWQCWKSYDYIEKEEAQQLFEEMISKVN